MPYSKRTFVCEQCGRKVTKRAPAFQRFCSMRCAGESRKVPRETRACATCGAPFEYLPHPSDKDGAGTYCSIDCRIIGTRTGYHLCPVCGKTVDSQTTYCCAEHAIQGRAHNRRTGKVMACAWCGGEVYMPKQRLENASHFFCCLDHQIEWQRRNKDHFVCKICGKEFARSPSHTKQNNVQYCSIRCRGKDPEWRAQLMRMNAMQQKTSPTSIERIGYGILDALGVEYVPQYTVNEKFCVDAFVPEHNLVVQFDGDYWHGHPERFPDPDHRQQKRMRYDLSQDAYMKACGISVVRFWGSDLRQRPEWVTQQVLSFLARP